MTKGVGERMKRREIARNKPVIGVWGEGQDFVTNLAHIFLDTLSLILGREVLLNHSMKNLQLEP